MTATQPSPAPSDEAALPGLSSGVGHYENFPVASLLTPPALRPAIKAIYHFARVADDIADEGAIAAETRLHTLAQYREALETCAHESAYRHEPWATVFGPLAKVIQRYHLPVDCLHALLSAFEQDVRYTANVRLYADMDELLDYCSRSANPVGRLLLHLYEVRDEASLRQSDQICSALQLINFWQDIREDAEQQRYYLPASALASARLKPGDLLGIAPGSAAAQSLETEIARLCHHARGMMMDGAPLALRLPGRLGWELRLVVQGGLRILDHIERSGFRSWQTRPALGIRDLPVMAWRALTMRRQLGNGRSGKAS